jgi:hypothetical protein
MNYKRRNTQTELVEYLTDNPCKTELELTNDHFNDKYRNKKYADLLRRAWYSNKIARVRVKLKGIDKRMVYRYYVPGTIKIVTQI